MGWHICFRFIILDNISVMPQGFMDGLWYRVRAIPVAKGFKNLQPLFGLGFTRLAGVRIEFKLSAFRGPKPTVLLDFASDSLRSLGFGFLAFVDRISRKSSGLRALRLAFGDFGFT